MVEQKGLHDTQETPAPEKDLSGSEPAQLAESAPRTKPRQRARKIKQDDAGPLRIPIAAVLTKV